MMYVDDDKPTPGPWFLVRNTYGEMEIRNKDEPRLGHCKVIAGFRCEHGMGDNERAANRRLIRAAPELLAVIEQAYEDLWAQPTTKQRLAILRRLRAAIALVRPAPRAEEGESDATE